LRRKKIYSMKKKYRTTIAEELFDAWKKLRRKGDPEEIMKLSGRSRPIVDRALNYGHVNDSDMVDIITDYYKERLEKESNDAKELLINSK